MLSGECEVSVAQGYSWAGILSLLCKKELMIPATWWGWLMWT